MVLDILQRDVLHRIGLTIDAIDIELYGSTSVTEREWYLSAVIVVRGVSVGHHEVN